MIITLSKNVLFVFVLTKRCKTDGQFVGIYCQTVIIITGLNVEESLAELIKVLLDRKER